MAPSLDHLPDELLLNVLSYVRLDARRYIFEDPAIGIPNPKTNQDLNCLSRCSRRLHAVVTPCLYGSITVGDETPLLLRSLLRHPHLRRYTQSLTLLIPTTAKLRGKRKAYFNGEADAELLKSAIKDTLRDDVWRQPPPEGWCRSRRHEQGYGADTSWRWRSAAYSAEDYWNAQCALLLVLMPSLTHLEIQTNASSFRFGVWPSLHVVRDYGPDCISLVMLAAAHTQSRALAAATDPARAPPADGVLPRLRSVNINGDLCKMKFRDMLSLALPPLVEELRLGDYDNVEEFWGCNFCARQMKLNLRTLVLSDCDISLLQIKRLLSCFPTLEKLVGYPTRLGEESGEPPTILQTLEGVAGTLKELDFSEDAWPFDMDQTYVPCGSYCGFSVLEKLSLSAERQAEDWQMKHDYPSDAVPPNELLLGQFPASLKELTFTSSTEVSILAILRALSHLLDTHEVPALRRITVGITERSQDHEAVLDVRRRCAARGIGLALPLVHRMQDLGPSYYGLGD